MIQRWQRDTLVMLLVVLHHLLICSSSECPGAETSSQLALRQAEVEPTAAGIKEFFSNHQNTPAQQREVQRLIRMLGSRSYADRRTAAVALSKRNPPPFDALTAALKSDNAEQAAQAQRLLVRMNRGDYHSVILRVLEVIHQEKLPGFADDLLDFPSIWRSSLFAGARLRAMTATLQPADLARLLEIATAKTDERRLTAIECLGQFRSPAVTVALMEILTEDAEQVQLAAALALADHGNRKCLSTLGKLLAAGEQDVRRRAAVALRQVTQQRFGYTPTDKLPARVAAASAWEAWLQQHATTVVLQPRSEDLAESLGRTLMTVFASKTLLEVDGDQQEQLKIEGYEYPWGCFGTPAGHRLVLDANRNLVIEYDSNGRECWRHEFEFLTDSMGEVETEPEAEAPTKPMPGVETKPKAKAMPKPVPRVKSARPLGVERLRNGNTLVALSDANEVIEINAEHKTVWSHKIKGRPTTVQRLADGSTVVNLQDTNRVVQIMPKSGEVRVLVQGLNKNHTAQWLDNGNVLVCDMGVNSVLEFDSSGNLVWSLTNLRNPAQAQRLKNGNTLVADERGVREYTRDEKIVWELNVPRARVHRY